MIRTALTTIAIAACALGCDPRVFGDLEGETWVVTSGQPDGMDSDDYLFAATFAGTTTTDGSRLVVMGNDPASLGTIRYSPNGDTDASGRRITDLVTIDETTSFDDRRPLAGSTSVVGTDGILALGLPAESNGDGTVLIVDLGSGLPEPHRPAGPLPGLSDHGAAVALGATDYEDATQGPGFDILASATNNIVLHPDVLATPAVAALNCPVGREAVYTVTTADVIGGDTGEEVLLMRGDLVLDGSATASDIVITTGSNIAAASQDVATNDCFDVIAVPPRAPLATIEAPGGESDFGMSIIAADFNGNTMTDIVATAPSSGTVYVFLDVDVGTVDAPDITIDAPSGAAGFGASVAAGDLDGAAGDELAIGAPSTAVDGTTGAGSVFVYKLNGASFGAPYNQLHDIEPEADQQFGRDVAIAPFGTAGGILAVGASGELFTYFRTKADFPDVRQ